MSNYKAIYASECCKFPVSRLPERVIIKRGAVVSYYSEQCTRCNKPCHTKLLRLWDSYGVEVRIGDIIEAIGCPDGHGEKHHAVRSDGYFLEIRDTGNNNVGMWEMWDGIKTLGHFADNLHLLDDDDLDYYFEVNQPNGKSEYRYEDESEESKKAS